MSSVVQSVLIPKNKFNRDEAIRWVRQHFTYKKIDSNQRPAYYSFRQEEPNTLERRGYNGYITKALKDGILLVIAIKK